MESLVQSTRVTLHSQHNPNIPHCEVCQTVRPENYTEFLDYKMALAHDIQ